MAPSSTVAVKPGNSRTKKRRPSELFRKKYFETNIWTGEREWDVVIKHNERYMQLTDLSLNSRHYKVLDMYKESSLSVYLIKDPKFEFTDNQPVGRPGFKWEKGVRENAVKNSPFSQLEADRADWNSLEAEG
jgi:hypothetical protein